MVRGLKITVLLIAIILLTFLSAYAESREFVINSGGIGAEIFGSSAKGYINPFFSISTIYSDNINNTKNSKKSDIGFVISPGICLALPDLSTTPEGTKTANKTPGGLAMSQFYLKSERQYQAYLVYNPDFERYSSHSENDADNHRLEGLFEYNFKGGLSVNFKEQYIDSHDKMGTGLSTELEEYKTNLFKTMLRYDSFEKFIFRIDYSVFSVDYKKSDSHARDRSDNSLTTYIFYKVMPKTSAFFEYKTIDIDYDIEDISSSSESHYFLGIKWDMTEKSQGSLKLGYGNKDFDDSNVDKSNDFLFELQAHHTFTPKRSANLTWNLGTEETDIVSTDYIRSNRLTVTYLQRFTIKMMANLTLSYAGSSYGEDLSLGGLTEKMDNDVLSFAPAFRYELKKWLMVDIVYSHVRRSSNFDEYDYTTNTLFLRVSGSL